MEGKSLEDLVAEVKGHSTSSGGEGPTSCEPRIWYNRHGDTAVCMTSLDESVADRVDDILTVFRSAIDDRIVGFQIKGVMALIRKLGYQQMLIEAEEADGQVIQISVVFQMLLDAYATGPSTQHRREGYALAMGAPFGGKPVTV